MAKKPAAGFDAQLKELEQLVTRMEQGDLDLDDALRQFEHGVALVRQCEQQLQAAEQKVQLLSRQGEQETLVAFDEKQSTDNAS
jgi:exodeoxyribonuclease VII small subunit